jgi:hypothetical protein
MFNERTCEPMYLNKISVILMYPVQIMYVRLNILDSFIWALHTMFSKWNCYCKLNLLFLFRYCVQVQLDTNKCCPDALKNITLITMWKNSFWIVLFIPNTCFCFGFCCYGMSFIVCIVIAWWYSQYRWFSYFFVIRVQQKHWMVFEKIVLWSPKIWNAIGCSNFQIVAVCRQKRKIQAP